MTFSLEVDHSICIKCSKCVRVCPAAIFVQPTPTSEVEVHNRENCIECGHCAAVCPTGAVKHSEFPPEKVFPVDRSELPTPEQLLLLIRSRRSNRAFTDKPVPDNLLELIVEAAYRAPTASNKHELEFTLVTDPEKLRLIIQYTADVFEEKIKNIQRPVVKSVVSRMSPALYKMADRLGGLIRMVREGKDPILRNATAALFIHTSAEHSYYGKMDANLAYQNGSLMAESLGVSQFYTGFVCRAIDEDKKRRFNELLGIEGKIHAGMGLGMPAFKFPNYIDRKEIVFRKI
ncbi:MAG: nitroreductase family protein [Tannerellaceae bacterium]|nr:nitroreductase family protein [Tannerellaceae bacterium]